jgi:rare lipoprotein A
MTRLFSFMLVAGLVCVLTGCSTTSQSYSCGATECGYASWYGSDSGRSTASGEAFNPRAFTAAHRHLPFGTIVRVTNRVNGQSVEVRINDRGPWSGGRRIIDVSSAAADALHMKAAGIVPVEIEVVHLGSQKDQKTVN